ncbi:hypothetical protein GQ55_3G207800 [Panicum hallii var. hallii]|uniref:Uncharacterized protein n=2 Tax=Panicum hallii TaxID=206008 RepID=A0A2T7EBM7_9POAL|nr:hypothetical protein PAHAL_3G218000 [Panicum hallii]PUZ65242.1 hypothetical protein GQ55_3G207800 [Panicum hallii var. hallii]
MPPLSRPPTAMAGLVRGEWTSAPPTNTLLSQCRISTAVDFIIGILRLTGDRGPHGTRPRRARRRAPSASTTLGGGPWKMRSASTPSRPPRAPHFPSRERR